jgi:multidrug transporter EmrE-like cation transporter
MNLLKTLPFILGVAVFTGLGDFFSKKYSLNPTWRLATYAMLGYSVGVVFWFRMIYYFQDLAVAGGLWTLISLSILLLISHFLFQEAITTKQMIGLGLGLIAIVLII